MRPNTDESLEQVTATLDQLMALVHKAGLADSAHLLAMAKLQLKLDLNGVTDREFRALCDAAEGRARLPRAAARARAGQARLRRDADMATTRRSFICATGATARRGGRRRNGTS